jgi:hypothetical protein
MKRFANLAPVLGLLSVLVACGGQDAPDTGAGETPPAQAPPPAAAPAPAPTAAAGQQTLSFNFGSVRAVLTHGATLSEPTTLQLSAAANVGGIGLPAGTYTLSATPSQPAWQFVIRSGATEVGTFNVTPSRNPAPVTTLTYEFEPAAGGDPGGELVMEWENNALLIPIEA